eukprot:2006354-Prymnesium_polylepis.1
MAVNTKCNNRMPVTEKNKPGCYTCSPGAKGCVRGCETRATGPRHACRPRRTPSPHAQTVHVITRTRRAAHTGRRLPSPSTTSCSSPTLASAPATRR